MWDKSGVELDADERRSVAFFAVKCPLHERGTKLNCVRRWLGIWFDRVSEGAVEGKTWVTGFGQIPLPTQPPRPSRDRLKAVTAR